MKKFMRNCAMTAFVFAVIGCALCAVGSFQAGGSAISQAAEDVTRGWLHVGRDGIWFGGWGIAGHRNLSVATPAIPEMSAGMGESRMISSDRKSYVDGNVSMYCPGDDIQDLKIEVGGCSLVTQQSADGNIYVEMVNARKFQAYAEDDTLSIKADIGSVINWQSEERVIILYLPDGCRFREVKAELGAGAMTLEGLRAKEISLEAGAGQIIVRDVLAEDKMDISIGAGSVELTGMEISKLDAEVGMGYLAAAGAIHESAKVECSMGNVEMTLEGSERDFNYKLDGAMGNIDIGSESFGGFSQEKKIDNKARKEIEIECSMGNITVRFTG